MAATVSHLPISTRPAGRSTTRPAGSSPWARLEPARGGTPVRRPGAPSRRRPRPAVVYRRRRFAAVVVLLALAFVAGVLLTLVVATPAGGSLTDEAIEAERVTHVVEPGDTLWGVARRLAPDQDPRSVVDRLAEARGSSTLIPGEVVAWPPQ